MLFLFYPSKLLTEIKIFYLGINFLSLSTKQNQKIGFDKAYAFQTVKLNWKQKIELFMKHFLFVILITTFFCFVVEALTNKTTLLCHETKAF